MATSEDHPWPPARTSRWPLTPFIPQFPVRRRLPWRWSKGTLYVPVLRLSAIAREDLGRLPIDDALRRRVKGGHAELEDLLDQGVQLRFWAWGTDQSTGAVAVCSSTRITNRDQVQDRGIVQMRRDREPPST